VGIRRLLLREDDVARLEMLSAPASALSEQDDD
jgi:hypothetical protein